MDSTATVRTYFEKLNSRSGWEDLIAATMAFTGATMKTQGKDAYVESTNQFLGVVKGVKLVRLFGQGADVSAIARYELASPAGPKMTLDISEIFTVENGKIASSVIFFDTAAFQSFMRQK